MNNTERIARLERIVTLLAAERYGIATGVGALGPMDRGFREWRAGIIEEVRDLAREQAEQETAA